jgi:hypothetical protein
MQYQQGKRISPAAVMSDYDLGFAVRVLCHAVTLQCNSSYWAISRKHRKVGDAASQVWRERCMMLSHFSERRDQTTYQPKQRLSEERMPMQEAQSRPLALNQFVSEHVQPAPIPRGKSGEVNASCNKRKRVAETPGWHKNVQ